MTTWGHMHAPVSHLVTPLFLSRMLEQNTYQRRVVMVSVRVDCRWRQTSSFLFLPLCLSFGHSMSTEPAAVAGGTQSPHH